MNKIFDYSEFERQAEMQVNSYNDATPYPYAFFDGLFDESILAQINQEISESSFKKDSRAIEGVEVKVRSDFEDNEALPRFSKKVFEVLNGGKFLKIVSCLTGIEGLISDPYYDGGGINIIKNKGTLAVHIDGTNQHRMKVCRRLNAILFINDTWDKSWNGYHEQWEFLNKEKSPFDDAQVWRCVRKILPKKNRLLIFTTNDHSWHGHAGLLDVPELVERRSLITYYYTATRPGTDLLYDAPHRANFINNNITLTESAFDGVEIVL